MEEHGRGFDKLLSRPALRAWKVKRDKIPFTPDPHLRDAHLVDAVEELVDPLVDIGFLGDRTAAGVSEFELHCLAARQIKAPVKNFSVISAEIFTQTQLKITKERALSGLGNVSGS